MPSSHRVHQLLTVGTVFNVVTKYPLTSLDRPPKAGTMNSMKVDRTAPVTRRRIPAGDVAFMGETMSALQELMSTSHEVAQDLATELGTPTEFAQRIYGFLPRRSPWAHVVGPVYTTAQLEKILGVSRQAIADRVRRRTLLGLHTQDGHVVYPVFQFEGTQVIGGLSEVLRIVVGAVDDWTLASWLVATQPTLGVSIIDALNESGASGPVMTLASATAERWSH